MAGYQPRHDTDPVWFNGTKINHLDVTSTGVGVRVTGVFGWDDRPDVRDVRELRSGQDGEYADNLFIGGRTITLEGEVYGSSWVNLQARKRTLAALFIPSSDEVLLKIPDPATVSPTGSYTTTGMTGYERASVRVIEGIQFGDTLDPMCQTWQVVLRASDPRVYSDTETSTDSGTSGTAARTVTVDQGGSHETPPVLTVTGPTSASIRVTEPSSWLFLETSGLTLESGEAVIFDTSDRLVSLFGTYKTVRARRSDAISVWMLDETSGTTADNAEGTAGYDGTYTGTYTLNQAGPSSGVVSVDLDGASGRVTTPFIAGLHPSVFSFEQWFQLDSVAGGPYTLAASIGSNKGWWLRYSPSSGLQFQFGNNSTTITVDIDSLSVLSVSTWYHVVIVVDGTVGSYTAYAYLNGVLLDTFGVPGFSASTANGLVIGATPANSFHFEGKIGPTAMYDRILTGAEVRELYGDLSAATGNEYGGAYSYLVADSARWATLGTASSTYTLASSGLDTGSKLNVSYRDARL